MASPIDGPSSPAATEPLFPFVSAHQAAAYIGDMAGSLRRIALRNELAELSRQLDAVEAECRRLLRKDEPRTRSKAG
jgi:uncharacterized caspase-like protein